MISKGKRKYLVRVYAFLAVLREFGKPNGGIDVMKLASMSTRFNRVPRTRDIDFDLRKAVGSSESWYKVNEIAKTICEDVLRQEQQLVRKPRLVSREVDRSDPTLPQGGHFIIPFPEHGPL